MEQSTQRTQLPARTRVLVIGMGQAGLSAAYHLRRRGFDTQEDLLLVDENPGPGGAWQNRWPELTLETTNHVSDLPGWGLREAVDVDATIPAAATLPRYYGAFEDRYALQVQRPVTAERVEQPAGPGTDFLVTLSFPASATDAAPGGDAGSDLAALPGSSAAPEGTGTHSPGTHSTPRPRRSATVRAGAVVSATGTWDRPRRPYVTGLEAFSGAVLHTHDYSRAEDFRGRRVLVAGGGISAVQHIEALARVAEVFWCARSAPDIRKEAFTPEYGQAVIARVEERVRAGLPPGSVVSHTGLPASADSTAGRCTLPECMPMFDRVTTDGVAWETGTAGLAGPSAAEAGEEMVRHDWGRVPASGTLQVDVLFWATGFLHRLDHIAPLQLRTPSGGIVMDGRRATRTAENPGLHLPGYGPSASTIGANRAGLAVAKEVEDYLAATAHSTAPAQRLR